MIGRGHEHVLRPVSVFDRPDGGRVIHSRCQAANGTPGDPMPACRLEEERVVRDGRVAAIRFRYGGLWFHPLELLRLLPVGIAECPDCHGERTLLPCERCVGVGVVEADGEGPLAIPDLRVNPA